MEYHNDRSALVEEADQRSFDRFMYDVNREISAHTGGLTSYDIEDYTYRDCFDSGMSPAETAREALENADFPFE